jgi:hypothetical protein
VRLLNAGWEIVSTSAAISGNSGSIATTIHYVLRKLL